MRDSKLFPPMFTAGSTEYSLVFKPDSVSYLFTSTVKTEEMGFFKRRAIARRVNILLPASFATFMQDNITTKTKEEIEKGFYEAKGAFINSLDKTGMEITFGPTLTPLSPTLPPQVQNELVLYGNEKGRVHKVITATISVDKEYPEDSCLIIKEYKYVSGMILDLNTYIIPLELIARAMEREEV